jgi:hypothetical protein
MDLLSWLTTFSTRRTCSRQALRATLRSGSQFDYLTITPNNGTEPTELTITSSAQQQGVKVLAFLNGNVNWL